MTKAIELTFNAFVEVVLRLEGVTLAANAAEVDFWARLLFLIAVDLIVLEEDFFEGMLVVGGGTISIAGVVVEECLCRGSEDLFWRRVEIFLCRERDRR